MIWIVRVPGSSQSVAASFDGLWEYANIIAAYFEYRAGNFS